MSFSHSCLKLCEIIKTIGRTSILWVACLSSWDSRLFVLLENYKSIKPNKNSVNLLMHSLTHYESLIWLFGAPNGVSTSITESKHIVAVKKPWRCSSKNNALKQILRTNIRLSQLTAARANFEARGMLAPLGPHGMYSITNTFVLSLKRELHKLLPYLLSPRHNKMTWN